MPSFRPLAAAAVAVLLAVGPRTLAAQAAPPDSARFAAFVRAHLAIASVRDRIQAELADPRSKKTEDQAALREKLKGAIAEALKQEKITQADFDHFTYLVATDTSARRLFDAEITALTSKKPQGDPT